ncbi:MAG TPA: lysophospholipid acyltransferase family protein [Solimonas sp.]|jgi:1-acyl-sn-glycerol-3-phosphate acyltransferase|nr:lysophospholipid acyltransferase family protein [Solimonas sp.]
MNHRLEIGPSVPRRRNRFLYWLGAGILRVAGWRVDVRLPDMPKFIVIAAPHTSNWDFVFGMAAILLLQVRIDWFGKHSLFEGPLAGMFRALGGHPVNRSSAGGVVGQAVTAFREREQLVLALAPEGTRSRREQWKRGFYHMAHEASVPVAVAYLDYGRRCVGIGPVFRTTGDWATDMRPVFAFYRGITPRHPDHFAVEDL